MGDMPHRCYPKETDRFELGLKQPLHVPSTDSTRVANGTGCDRYLVGCVSIERVSISHKVARLRNHTRYSVQRSYLVAANFLKLCEKKQMLWDCPLGFACKRRPVVLSQWCADNYICHPIFRLLLVSPPKLPLFQHSESPSPHGAGPSCTLYDALISRTPRAFLPLGCAASALDRLRFSVNLTSQQ